MQITKKRVLVTLWLVGLLAPILWTLRILFGDPAPVEVSEETTVLTGDTLEDGTLDFSAALWKRCNSTVDESANAGIELSRLPLLLSSWERYRRLFETSEWQGRNRNMSSDRNWSQAYRELQISQQQLWHAESFPMLARLVRAEEKFVPRWKAAVQKPRLVKPIGVTLNHLLNVITQGGDMLLRRAMKSAAEGRWADAVDDLQDVDRGALLLAELQCGWHVTNAYSMRSAVSRALARIVLDVKQIPPELESFIRTRSKWDPVPALANALDNAVRIRFQIAVRDLRDEPHRIEAIVGSGLVGSNRKAQELQLTRIRNSINWTMMSRRQNEDVDAYLDIMREPGFGHWWDTFSTLSQQMVDRDTSHMIPNIRDLHLANITEDLSCVVSNMNQYSHLFSVFHARIDVERHRRRSLAALAFALFRQEHGEFPTTITQLSSGRSADAYRAFESGEPLRYSTTRGTFQLEEGSESLLDYDTADAKRYELLQ